MRQEIIRIDLDGVNSYLLKANNQFILVDTGGHIVMDKVFSNRRELLEQAIEKHSCNSENLKLILLTHGDNDHICNAAHLRDKYKAKIALHKADFYLAERPSVDDFMKSFRYRSFIYKIVFKLMQRTIRKVAVKTNEDFKTFSPDVVIDKTFNLSDFGFNAEIIHLPGHTPGGVAILTKDGDLIAGDIFANMKKPEVAPNALDFKLMDKSVDKLKSYKVNTIYPGHGEPFSFQGLRTK